MSRKVLVVDDDRKTVALVKLYLEREGFSVLQAYDGITALELARREKPAVIVLDLMLPGLEGETICSTLRSESDVAILMLTARATLCRVCPGDCPCARERCLLRNAGS